MLTFDYRGVGASAPRALRGYQADFLTWGEQDLAAAVGWARGRGEVLVVGHSFGGQAYGLLAADLGLRGLLAFGTGNGWHGHMAPLERIRVLALWHLLGPVLTRWYGYLPGDKVGLGEPLPLGVYYQWKRWCAREHHWFDDPRLDMSARFATVRGPVVGFNAADDAWAGPQSAQAFLKGYTQAALELRTVAPASVGVAHIGHMGYFRAAVGEQLWPQVLERAKEMSPP